MLTEALIHAKTLHYNGISHQQYERQRWAEKGGERESRVIKCLPLPNCQLACQSHKSNCLIASLPLLCLSSGGFSLIFSHICL